MPDNDDSDDGNNLTNRFLDNPEDADELYDPIAYKDPFAEDDTQGPVIPMDSLPNPENEGPNIPMDSYVNEPIEGPTMSTDSYKSDYYDYEFPEDTYEATCIYADQDTEDPEPLEYSDDNQEK